MPGLLPDAEVIVARTPGISIEVAAQSRADFASSSAPDPRAPNPLNAFPELHNRPAVTTSAQ